MLVTNHVSIFPSCLSYCLSSYFANISEDMYGLWELCLQGGKQNHDERWFILNILKLILFRCLWDMSVPQWNCSVKYISKKKCYKSEIVDIMEWISSFLCKRNSLVLWNGLVPRSGNGLLAIPDGARNSISSQKLYKNGGTHPTNCQNLP